MSLLCAAQQYLQGGLSVIPCRRQSKRPLVDWKPYQSQPPQSEQLSGWFQQQYTDALALITGPVSGKLEVLDFDAPPLFAPWYALVQQREVGLIPRLPVVKTQSGGFHVYYRAPKIQGNQKLAVDPARPQGKYTLIETRGTGGYVLAPPSAGYELLQGNLYAIPTLSTVQREILLTAARVFNRKVESVPTARPPARARRPRAPGDKLLPGAAYNQQGDVAALLARHGWRCVHYTGVESHWRRPGKRHGSSATLNYGGSRLFYVFTTNAPPFEPETSYTPFGVFAWLECGGDFQRAAQRLKELGYGE